MSSSGKSSNGDQGRTASVKSLYMCLAHSRIALDRDGTPIPPDNKANLNPCSRSAFESQPAGSNGAGLKALASASTVHGRRKSGMPSSSDASDLWTRPYGRRMNERGSDASRPREIGETSSRVCICDFHRMACT